MWKNARARVLIYIYYCIVSLPWIHTAQTWLTVVHNNEIIDRYFICKREEDMNENTDLFIVIFFLQWTNCLLDC